MQESFSETGRLLGCDDSEERQKLLAKLFTAHKQRLRLMVQLRLHPRLYQTLDPSDALQEAFLVASKRLEEYLGDPRMPLFLWLRLITAQKLHELHSFHLGIQKRDARRGVPLDGYAGPAASTVALANRLLSPRDSPSEVAMQSEKCHRVKDAIDKMHPLDREILALRFYESLTSAEAAQALEIEEEAARKRYLRAMKRLKGFLEEFKEG